MQQWEYRTWWIEKDSEGEWRILRVNDQNLGDPPRLMITLVDAGEDGWEIVGVHPELVFFKRPKVEA